MNNIEKYKLKDIGKWEDSQYDYRAMDKSNLPGPEKKRFKLVTTSADILSHYDELSLNVSGLRRLITVERLDPFDEDYENKVMQYYRSTDPDKHLDYTVPLLVDTETGRIVSNDPFDIAELFETVWSDNSCYRIYDSLKLSREIFTNLYVEGYRAGYAEDQIEYNAGYQTLFMEMDLLEAHLGRRRLLCGDTLTDADLLLYAFLVRFDIQYVAAFRINRNLLRDFPNLERYAKNLHHLPGFGEGVDFDAIKKYAFLKSVVTNPYGKLPLGPDMSDWEK